jgi:hypothetical protein
VLPSLGIIITKHLEEGLVYQPVQVPCPQNTFCHLKLGHVQVKNRSHKNLHGNRFKDLSKHFYVETDIKT